MQITDSSENTSSTGTPLVRGIGLGSATALNMIDMIGVGPFITIPLIVTAMGGPQAMLGWILGALLAICDGLVWAELGAALPGSGGSYRYLKEIYGPQKLGRLVSFLFIWQLSFSAPLSIASGAIGLSQYAAFFWPNLEHVWSSRSWSLTLPIIGPLQLSWVAMPATFLAIGVCALTAFLLYRRITAISRLTNVLWAGVMATIGWIIFTGLTHFNAHQAFDLPPGAFSFSRDFFRGLGGAMLIASYDIGGYYNVCFLGDEVKNPGKNIPRALLLSILAVASLYIVMNVSILGVIPWRELVQAGTSDTKLYIVSTMMQRVYGQGAASLISVLVMWTAFASVFSLTLGYSRVPYAAALDGNYFRSFARVHPKYQFPYVSLLALAGVAALFCFLRLADLIAALIVIRIVLQFLVQSIGVIVLRIRRPDLPRPFRMWLYPLPALIAAASFTFILISRKNFLREIRYAGVILIVGLAIYMVRSWRRREWPFRDQSLIVSN
ncbi:MAG TPA: amino acid permease [Terriglobales bacterium]|jgi:APA family basic amino acid/polyamine antiporter|nr:amino acid permease [Terriglobales bacterium]